MLPVMKDGTHKIERLYKPAGYRFAIPIGKLGGQNKIQFYARFLPKYKEFYGNAWVILINQPLLNKQEK